MRKTTRVPASQTQSFHYDDDVIAVAQIYSGSSPRLCSHIRVTQRSLCSYGKQKSPEGHAVTPRNGVFYTANQSYII